jgi:hypothetical protein
MQRNFHVGHKQFKILEETTWNIENRNPMHVEITGFNKLSEENIAGSETRS